MSYVLEDRRHSEEAYKGKWRYRVRKNLSAPNTLVLQESALFRDRATAAGFCSASARRLLISAKIYMG